ncbi:uncharacterized protein K452DRAFT_291893 [Neofusicoccum parvum]|nr:uncharacterized protein K452DRAFT_291893 [Neofusicoccum parvum]
MDSNHGSQYEIPETDPDDIKHLWNDVHTRAPKRDGEDTDITTDPLFFDKVLKPRNLVVVSGLAEAKKQCVWNHFLVEEAPEDTSTYYRGISGLSKTTLWMPGDYSFVEEIVIEYQAMIQYWQNELEFVSYCTEKVLKRELRRPNMPKSRTWQAERLLNYSIKPFGHWKEPPVVFDMDTTKRYGWDLFPDVAYWLSLQDHTPKDRTFIEDYVQVHDQRLLCRYFSGEFKKDDRDEDAKSRDQLAAAAMMALYNRWQLRKDAQVAIGCEWGEMNHQDIRHYGATLQREAFKIWGFTPIINNSEWHGCKMLKLTSGYFNEEIGVTTFRDWINEIHRWGLTIHGPSVYADALAASQPRPQQAETSPITLKRARDNSGEELF